MNFCLTPLACLLQAEEPKPLNAAAAAALQSEYTSKYATKSDAAKINFALLTTSYLIGKATRTKEEVARSVITKCLNSIHGTISYPIALTSYYLAGYGDHTISHDTFSHSHHEFTASVREPECVDEADQLVDYDICIAAKDQDQDDPQEQAEREEMLPKIPTRAAVVSKQKLYHGLDILEVHACFSAGPSY